jgi:hypothetical protein
VKDDVLDRIQRALDRGVNLEEDLDLQRIFATDPEAAQVAAELAAIDAALRRFPTRAPSDSELDAMVSKISLRLDEALPPIADPTLAPPLDDDEIPVSIAPVASSETPALAALAEVERPSLDSLPPELLESIPPEAPEEAIPRAPLPPTGERFSLTSIAPPPPLLSLPPSSTIPPEASPKSRAGVVIVLFGATLAAAAAVLLVVFTQMGGREADLAYAPSTTESRDPGALQLDEAAPPPSPGGVVGGQAADGLDSPALDSPEQATRGGDFYVNEGELDTASAAPAEMLAPVATGRFEGAEQSVTESLESRRRERPALAEPEAAPDGVRDEHADRDDQQRQHNQSAEPTDGVSRARSNPEPEEAERGGGGATPSRDEVVAAMRAIAPQVASCGGGARSGVAEVRVRVGSSGRVQSSVVVGQFAGTPEGSCIARAVRGARLPAFRADSFDFTYPFRLE